jgi:hypothetical protein
MLGFAWPIVLDRIGWYTYTIFIGWDLFQAIIIYIYIPETKNRTVSYNDLPNSLFSLMARFFILYYSNKGDAILFPLTIYNQTSY